MHQEIRSYVSTCLMCQSNKPSSQLPMGLLQSLPIPEKLWDTVTMDLITQLPRTSRGNDAIVVFIDKLSKMAHYCATTTTVTAVQLAEIFLHQVVRHHGVPTSIVSDRDPRFTSIFWRSLWQQLGTRLAMSTAFHPQTDGQTERANRTLEEGLRAYVGRNQLDWDQHLLPLEIALTIRIHASTGFTPYYLNSGQEINLTNHVATRQPTANKAAADRLQQLSNDITTAKENLLASQQRQQKAANRDRRDVDPAFRWRLSVAID